MPKLNCCVGSCAYNEEDNCCLGKIRVQGGEIAVPSETCCESFIPKGSIANNITTPNECISIDCEAIQCAHNEVCKCHAECVFIVGQDAGCSNETQCNTFCKY